MVLEIIKIRVSQLVAHEEFREDHVEEVKSWFLRDGYQGRPIAVTRLDNFGKHEYYLVLDGHHRSEAARRLGLTYIMATVIDYFDDRYRVLSWANGKEYSKRKIIDFAFRGILLPPKTTKHLIVLQQEPKTFQDNDLIEPIIKTPLTDLK